MAVLRRVQALRVLRVVRWDDRNCNPGSFDSGRGCEETTQENHRVGPLGSYAGAFRSEKGGEGEIAVVERCCVCVLDLKPRYL